mgnify:CR=1 FL=1
MFLNRTIFGNTLLQWIIALGAFLLILVVFSLVKRTLHNRIKKLADITGKDIVKAVADVIVQTKALFLFIISAYIASLALALPEKTDSILGKIVIISLLVQSAFWGGRILNYWSEVYRRQKIKDDTSSLTAFNAMGFVLRLVLWVVIILLILDNLGINITSLVAGLGIGGIAVALAVQNILGDLFASLSILFDKPFVIGDFVIIDDYLGTIEYIGLKTTRIRSLSGEQLVFSNADLISSRIRNYKRMNERRVVFSVGVIYNTTAEKLEEIPLLIKEIIERKGNVRFDRTHFKQFGNFSLDFEIVYWMQTPDYNIYMDTQQSINLDIYRVFKERGIEFAFPTQTIHINKT